MWAALVMMVLGIVAFPMETVVNPEPEARCAPAGAAKTSGFVDEESGCAITIESWEEVSDWRSSPKWFRIMGLALVFFGLVGGIVGLILFLRGRTGPAAPSATGPPSDPAPPALG